MHDRVLAVAMTTSWSHGIQFIVSAFLCPSCFEFLDVELANRSDTVLVVSWWGDPAPISCISSGLDQ